MVTAGANWDNFGGGGPREPGRTHCLGRKFPSGGGGGQRGAAGDPSVGR